MQIPNCIIDKKKIETFWNLVLLSNQEYKGSACEKVLPDIEFVNNRYKVFWHFRVSGFEVEACFTTKIAFNRV